MVDYEGVALQKRTKFITRQAIVGRVLDIGCGTGSISKELGSLGFTVTSTDLDEKSIKECRINNRYVGKVSYLVADAKVMDLHEKFDIVIASEVIEHISQPELVIKNIYKHLKDDGIGIISIPNGYCLWEIVVSHFLQKNGMVSWLYKSPKLFYKLTGAKTPFYSKNSLCFHVNYFTYGKFVKLLNDNGFKVRLVKHSDLGLFPEWKSFRIFKKIECNIADYVPHFMAGGWLLVIERSNNV